MKMKISVTNIDYRATEQDLKRFFLDSATIIGEDNIAELEIHRSESGESKGEATVEIKGESAQTDILGLNGQSFRGRNLTITPVQGTQLILTVGTNPLPVWVAWHHLKDILPPPVHVQFVFTNDSRGTDGTRRQKDLLKQDFNNAGTPILTDIPTSASVPNADDICEQILGALPPYFNNIHVHYTGGTQAMGVVTMYAAKKAKDTLGRPINLDGSYLDPGRSSEPTIVNLPGNRLVPDTRVNAELYLNQVSKLNNFTAQHGASPAKSFLTAGETLLEFNHSNERTYRGFKGQWDDCFTKTVGREKKFRYPDGAGSLTFPSCIQPTLEKAFLNCRWDTTNGALLYDNNVANENERADVKKMHEFLSGKWLEYAAYSGFKAELDKMGDIPYSLSHNVLVQRNVQPRPTPFELDVVAVLGYQVVVVSCSVSSRRKEIKLKAMEAYHRAKQLGGDEAHAIIISAVSANDADDLQKELADETGTEHPLQVWGKKTDRKLPDMNILQKWFRGLLKVLHCAQKTEA